MEFFFERGDKSQNALIMAIFQTRMHNIVTKPLGKDVSQEYDPFKK